MSSPLSKDELGILRGVPLEVEAEVARLAVSLQSLLDIRPGSTIPFSRADGDSVDIYVGGVLLARGRVTPVKDRLQVEITEVETTDAR